MRSFFCVIIFSLSTICAIDSYGQLNKTDYRPHYKRAVELFDAGQYATGVTELLKAQSMLGENDAAVRTDIDFYLFKGACMMGQRSATVLGEQFLRERPGSIYANETRLLLAENYYAAKDYAKALEYYEKHNKKGIDAAISQEINFKRGYCYLQADSINEAEQCFSTVRRISRYYNAAQYYLAYLDYVNRRYDNALETFNTLLEDKDFGAIVPFYILQIEFLKGNYDAVIAKGDALMAKTVESRRAEICRIIADSYFQRHEYADALDYMDQYIDNKGNMGFAELYLKGYSHHMIGEWTEAEEALSKIAYTNDELGQNSAYYLGATYLKMNDKRKAAMAFSLSSKMDFNPKIKEESLFVGAKLQHEIGGDKFNETINAFLSYVNDYPDSDRNAEAREYLLSAYFNARNYEAALESLAYIKNPDNNIKSALQKISYFRALEHYNNRDYDKANEMLTTTVANSYNSKYTALGKYWKAETLQKLGQFNAAIPLYNEYLRLAPRNEREYAMAIYNTAYCYFSQKKWNEARNEFQKFIATQTPNKELVADTYNRLGDIDFLSRNYSAAAENYAAAANLKTKQAEYADFQSAIVLGLTNKTEAKINKLKSIIDNSKSEYTDDAMMELAGTYIKSDMFSDGANTLKKFLEKYPESPFIPAALAELGLTFQNMANDMEALKYYKLAVQNHPTSSRAKDALIGIRNIYIDRNDIEAYVKFASTCGIETNITVTEKDSLVYTSAERIYLSGNMKAAEKAFEAYINEFPRGAFNSAATYFAADAMTSAGDKTKALQYAEKLCEMPINVYTERGLKLCGDLNAELGHTDKAVKTYKRLIELTKNREVGTNALGRLLSAVVKSNDQKAVIEAADYVRGSSFISDNLAFDADFAQAKALLSLGDKAGAMTYLKEVSSNTKRRESAEASYRIIEILYSQNKMEDAEKEIYALSDTNPDDQIWLGKSFIILGDIYAKQGDNFQAKATYQSIVDGYAIKDDGVIDEAKTRIKALK